MKKRVFLSSLFAKRLPSGKFRLTRGLIANVSGFSRGVRTVLKVPQGFVTDFASVPRLPFLFALLGDRVHGPAVLHDWLYRHPGSRTRRQVDNLFRLAMASDHPKEPLWRRWLIYAGVRLFGYMAWARCRRRYLSWTEGGEETRRLLRKLRS